MTEKTLVSNAFQAFLTETPDHAGAWMEVVKGHSAASALDPKTAELIYVAVLAVARLESGIPFHVKQAKALGATREEITSAILTGLPAVGHAVIQSLPTALQAFDAEA
jgi:AhpD family alkylhydroperoxidase